MNLSVRLFLNIRCEFHKLAKDAGNKLCAYVLIYCSTTTGVFFLALTGKKAEN
jgi:hypothetical protein